MNYTAGDYTYGALTVIDWHQGTVCTVGKYCSIAEPVTVLLGGEHRTDGVATYAFRERDGIGPAEPNSFSKGDVVIGNDVWIGWNATILSGVTIGDGAVIGARAVVRKDVPPYAIALGNPARVARYRFTPAQIARLLEVKWWDWDRGRIVDNAALLSGDVEAFLASVP
jgi:acetyltransferase-like isoleucine patch superfamily enzyme